MALSIIVPNFNHGPFIGRALRALAPHVPPTSEIIVVDDGSTDNSIEVIEDIRGRHPFIRLLRHDINRGVFAAVQTALDAATGKYLFFSAADDFVLPGLLSRAIAALDKNPEAAFFCSSVAVLDAQDKVIGFRPATIPRESAGYVSSEDVRRMLRETDNFIIGSSVVHRRKHLASIGYFDESLGSLCDSMAYRLLALEHGFYFDPDVLASWRISSQSFSAKSSLSVAASRSMVDTGTRWIRHRLPEDIRDQYAPVFDRRLRFSMGRLWIVWRLDALDVDAMVKVMDLTSLDRAVMNFLSRVPFVSSQLVLAWTAMRMRPYSLRALLKGWWHNRKHNRPRSAEIERLLAAARSP